MKAQLATLLALFALLYLLYFLVCLLGCLLAYFALVRFALLVLFLVLAGLELARPVLGLLDLVPCFDLVSFVLLVCVACFGLLA